MKILKSIKIKKLNDWHWLVLAYLSLSILHSWLNLGMENPVVYDDEAGYFGNARFLASGYGLPFIGTQYYPGYSLFLVPLLKFLEDPIISYRCVLVFNGFLISSTVLWLYLSGRKIWTEIPKQNILIASIAVSCYTSFFGFSNLVMSENLYIPLFSLLLFLVCRAFQKDAHYSTWIPLGIVSLFLLIVHPKALPIVAAVFFLSIKVLYPLKKNFRSFFAFLCGALVTLAFGFWIRQILLLGNPRVSSNVSGYDSTALNAITEIFNLKAVISLFYEVVGQLFYLAVSTYSLAIVGLAISLVYTVQFLRKKDQSYQAKIYSFIGLSFLGTLLLSSFFMNGNMNRLDHLIYGRYNEGVLAPLMMVSVLGFFSFSEKHNIRSRELLGLGLAIISLATVFLIGRSLELQNFTRIVRINILGIYPYMVDREQNFDYLLLVIIAIGIGLPLLKLLQQNNIISLVLLTFLFLSSGYRGSKYLVNASHGTKHIRSIPSALNQIYNLTEGQSNCLIYGDNAESNYAVFATARFLAPKVSFLTDRLNDRFNESQEHCKELFLSGKQAHQANYSNARIVMLENHHNLTLWSKPGNIQEQLLEHGMLLPESFPSPLPEAALRSRIEILSNKVGTSSFSNGDKVVVSLTHIGESSPWPNRYGLKQSTYSVRLGVRWYQKGSDSVLTQSRIDLPKMMTPGETQEVSFILEPDIESTLEPGSYEVLVGLVQEGVTWFYDKGDNVLKLSVRVEK